jgi:alpha-galactosidase
MKTVTPTGIETDASGGAVPAASDLRAARTLTLDTWHWRLIQVMFMDQTDIHNELVQEREWLLHPSERLELQGNLFALEDPATGAGTVFIRKAALPHARPVKSGCDLRLTPVKGKGFTLELLVPAAENDPEPFAAVPYTGGPVGRTRTLQAFQRAQRPAHPNHAVPLFMSNTWGDRSQDSRIEEGFLLREIEAAARLGVDVLQIDDGWQRGTTANSAKAKQLGGVWQGFWAADPQFWDPHPVRLPRGLAPVATAVCKAGLRLGLWFAPDSAREFANWQRDADRLITLYREYGITFFKVDGVVAETIPAAANLRRFFDAVRTGTHNAVVFDLDITAQVRPGYFGAMDTGVLFVENRYTDWHNHWPHQTLRNLWQLSRWIDPARLRMECLNNSRNTALYANDPLAPAAYTPDTLFATVMCANPLGWFEVSNLPQAYFDRMAPLVRVWKNHRKDLFADAILPIGLKPDGWSWTGFAAVGKDDAATYALLFRELSPEATCTLNLPGPAAKGAEILAGKGRAHLKKGELKVRIDAPRGYAFVRLER